MMTRQAVLCEHKSFSFLAGRFILLCLFRLVFLDGNNDIPYEHNIRSDGRGGASPSGVACEDGSSGEKVDGDWGGHHEERKGQ